MFKKMFLVLTVLALPLVLFAQENPIPEPGLVVALSQDSTEVANILLNRQLSDCVSELKASVYEVVINKVTSQGLKPGKTRYVFSGVALEGGDIAVGTASLSVTETLSQGVFGNPFKGYSCTVVLPKHK